MPDQPPEKNKPEENIWRQIGRYSHLGFVLPASIVVGLAIGAALDHWLKTTWLTLAGLLLGCVAGFFELIRVIVQASKES
ncbi:MAG TPA: AtpZ/AtpI family protein [Candidatus Angelobacter sp.]|jgi:F0F1-type ATP synthase assembly protein I